MASETPWREIWEAPDGTPVAIEFGVDDEPGLFVALQAEEPTPEEVVEDLKVALAGAYGLDVPDWERALEQGHIGDSRVLLACSDGDETVISLMVCRESKVPRRALALMEANPCVSVGIRRLDSFEDGLSRVREWEPEND